MILYMDVYITDTPLFKNLYDELTELRSKAKIWNMPSKIDITLYTLASYALYPWSSVLIKYELEDEARYDYFESEIRKIFPNAVLVRGRSDSQEKYQESIKMLEKMSDEWIFYCGNNDHPFVFEGLGILGKCFEKAKEMKKRYRFVSVWYSHILEGAGILSKDNHFRKILNVNNICDSEVLYEDEYLIVTKRDRSFTQSTQIVHMDLFRHWFSSTDLSGKKVRRADDLVDLVKTEAQILILPKKRICEHFDGYGNLNSRVGFEVDTVVPPLFLPPGFFEKDVKIAYGYEDYREGWVNVNPLKGKYAFQDSANGTDMKIRLEDLPMFWKERISKIDINPDADRQKLDLAGKRNLALLSNPWPKSALSSYITKFVISPAWRVRKLSRRTQIYLSDPEYLEKTKNDGDFFFRMYKKGLTYLAKKK